MNNMVPDIERIVHDAVKVDVDGQLYSVHDLKPVQDRTAIKQIGLSTLTGLKDYIEGNFDKLDSNEMYIVVSGYNEVDLFLAADRATKIRQYPVAVKLDKSGKEFPFGTFMAVEDFIIRVSSTFIETDNLKELLGYVSKLTVNNSLQTEDDGVTQTATVKRGVNSAFKDVKVAPSRIALQPRRTFPEVEQPVSEFVFRMKVSGESIPLCALIEADGGRWKADAAQNIKMWLMGNIKQSRVIA